MRRGKREKEMEKEGGGKKGEKKEGGKERK